MMTHAYSPIYLSKAARAVGNMLHDAVYVFDMNGNLFLGRLIQSGIAEEIERGNPKYIAGMSGVELFLEVMERTAGTAPDTNGIESYDRSDAYWAGWMLTHYQWYSGRSFRTILDTVSFDDLLSLYGTLHEADIQKSYEAMDAHFADSGSRLKELRKRCGITQAGLSDVSGVSVNTIRAYEQKSKDLNKAQFEIVISLARALKCDVGDLIP